MEENVQRKTTSNDPGGWVPVLSGLALGALSIGLPMIGVTVNLVLGFCLLALAFALIAVGLWKWEGKAPRRKLLRTITIVALAFIYFLFIGRQIYSQYRKDHPLIAERAPSPPPPIAQTPKEYPAQSSPETRPKVRSRRKQALPPPVSVGGGITQGGDGSCQANAIGGNATVENCDSSALKPLSQSKMNSIHDSARGRHEVTFLFDESDTKALDFYFDMVKALSGTDWTVKSSSGFGGDYRMANAITIKVGGNAPEISDFKKMLGRVMALDIPLEETPTIPAGQIYVSLTSKPFKRPE